MTSVVTVYVDFNEKNRWYVAYGEERFYYVGLYDYGWRFGTGNEFYTIEFVYFRLNNSLCAMCYNKQWYYNDVMCYGINFQSPQTTHGWSQMVVLGKITQNHTFFTKLVLCHACMALNLKTAVNTKLLPRFFNNDIAELLNELLPREEISGNVFNEDQVNEDFDPLHLIV